MNSSDMQPQTVGYMQADGLAAIRTQAGEQRPTPKAEDKIYRISITQLDRGYHVEVGCKSFAIASATELITMLSTYILQPSATVMLFQDGKLF